MKVGAPTEFTGARTQVEPFILQCRIVFAIDHEKWTSQHKRLMYIVSYMKGPAFEFIQPYLKDYLEHLSPVEDRKDSTRAILRTSDTLFQEIRSTFGYGNEQQEAERAIQNIRQRNSAAKYKAEFQILVAKLNWNDEAIAAQFYQGLKENIKDEIAKGDRPTTFKGMSDLAIKIDTRIWERQLERKGNFPPVGANRKVQREPPEWRDNYYGLQKMQLDATKGKPSPRKGWQGKPGPRTGQRKKPFDKSNLACHNCGQKGHFARECLSRKQRHELQGTTPRGTIAATKQDSHAGMSWTACYEDTCTIHRSDKEGSGWWPKGPKAQKMCVLRTMEATTTPEDTEEDTSEEESAEEEESSENEQGSSLAMTNDEVLTFTMEGHGEAMQMFTAIARHYEEVFPRVGDKRYLHPHQLERLLQQLRTMFWGHRLVKVQYDHATFVQEYPPLGSKFVPNGYLTPAGILVTNDLRSTLTQLKKHYRTEQGAQTLLGRIDTGTYHEVQQRAERQRHNEQVTRRFCQFRRQTGDTRLLTYEQWQELQGATPPPSLPLIPEELVRKSPMYRSYRDPTPVDDTDGSGNE